MLHTGRREQIRILRAMLRPGLLNGISGRDEEIAAALRVCARYRDLHGALDIAASAGLEVEGMADAIRLGLPEAGWSVMLRPIGSEGEAAPEVDLRVERDAAPDPALPDGQHASEAGAAAVTALALGRRALARLADGSEGDTALPAPAFVWPILERIGGREVVVRVGEILEVLERSSHQSMVPTRLEMARRALEEEGVWPGARGRGLRADERLGEPTRRAVYGLCGLRAAPAGAGSGRDGGGVQHVSGSRALTVQVVSEGSGGRLKRDPKDPSVDCGDRLVALENGQLAAAFAGAQCEIVDLVLQRESGPILRLAGEEPRGEKGWVVVPVPVLAIARRMRFMARGPLDGRGACSATSFSGDGAFGP